MQVLKGIIYLGGGHIFLKYLDQRPKLSWGFKYSVSDPRSGFYEPLAFMWPLPFLIHGVIQLYCTDIPAGLALVF